MSEPDRRPTDLRASRMLLRRRSVLFWDFDGVIKDSVDAKGAAFEQLFVPFGTELAARVRRHHEQHGGVSRYDKLRLYLEWAGEAASDAQVDRYCELFGAAARRAVIESDWVPGAREYLEEHHRRQSFILISATPQHELEGIVAALGAAAWFRRIHGSPASKADAIARSLGELRCACPDALVIGDSDADYEAAARNGVEFLLRRTAFNAALQQRHTGFTCADFREL